MAGFNRQRGELSLWTCALLFAALALAAMAGLFSMRSERNFFAEAWSRATRSAVGQSAQRLQSAAANLVKSGTVEAAEIRKCTIDGKLVYSNVECSAKSPNSRQVDLHDSGGIEAPKAPPGVETERKAPGGPPPNVQDKMIDKATR